jgi:hypothetical protein
LAKLRDIARHLAGGTLPHREKCARPIVAEFIYINAVHSAMTLRVIAGCAGFTGVM